MIAHFVSFWEQRNPLLPLSPPTVLLFCCCEVNPNQDAQFDFSQKRLTEDLILSVTSFAIQAGGSLIEMERWIPRSFSTPSDAGGTSMAFHNHGAPGLSLLYESRKVLGMRTPPRLSVPPEPNFYWPGSNSGSHWDGVAMLIIYIKVHHFDHLIPYARMNKIKIICCLDQWKGRPWPILKK